MKEEQPEAFLQHLGQVKRNGEASKNLPEESLHPDSQMGSAMHGPPMFEQVLDTEEAAALLHIHPKTLQRLARKGEIPGFRIGKLWGFRASALNQWLESTLAGCNRHFPSNAGLDIRRTLR